MAHQAFQGSIPDDRWYCTHYDMWVKPEGEHYLVGATSFGLFLAGEVIAFTAKPKGAEVAWGKGLGTIECRKTVLAVHAPLSFILLQGNEDAEERPALLGKAPYDAGWMVRVEATDWDEDSARLVNAAAYKQHVLSMEPEACFD